MEQQEVMGREEFLGHLKGWLEQVRSSVEASAVESEDTGLEILPPEALPKSLPRTISVSIGGEDGPAHIVDVTMHAQVMNGYERDFKGGVAMGTGLWPELASDAHRGIFDEDLFLDMAACAFEKLLKGADEDSVSRRDAYLALAIGRFADVDAEISEEFAAAQLVAEALSSQACGGWQKIDGKTPTDRLVVFKEGRKVIVDMAPVDLSALLVTTP